MSDPLSLLRNFHCNKKPICQVGDYICFDTIAYEKSCLTNFLVHSITKGASNVDKVKEYYRLETLHFFLENIDKRYVEYFTASTAKKIIPVRFPDRKELMNILTNEAATSSNIDRTAPLPQSSVTRTVIAEFKSREEFKSNDVNKNLEDGLSNTLIDGDEDITNNFEKAGDAAKAEKSVVNEKKLNFMLHHCVQLLLSQQHELHLTERVVKYCEKILQKSNPVSKMRKRSNIEENRYEHYDSAVRRRRDYMLSSVKKDFSIVLGYINQKDNVNNEPQKFKNIPSKFAGGMVHGNKEDLYDRYGQEKFKKQEDTAGFKINVNASFKSINMSGSELDASIQEQGNLIEPEVIQKKSRTKTSLTPIIVVPLALKTCININNIKAFLEAFSYKSVEEKSSQLKESDIFVYRKRKVYVNGRQEDATIPYHCINNVKKLTSEDWNRVVAVFVHGPTWQFKDWPWQSHNMAELFSHVRGFYVGFQNEQVDDNLKKWNIEILNISRTKRHTDHACVCRFWNKLDEFLKSANKNVRF